jgi:site-specific recombinase XerD
MAPPLKISLPDLPDDVREILLDLPGGELAIDPVTLATRLVGGRGDSLAAGDVAPLVAEFVDHLRVAEDLKPQTLDGYRCRLGQFARWLAVTGCDPAEPATWTAYHAALQERRLSPFTRKGHYDRLRRFGRWLAETGRLAANPMDGIHPPRLPRERAPRAIPREAIRAMLRAATEPRERALLLFFRDSGGRAMEALGATWGDVDMEGRRVTVQGKGDKARVLRFRPVTAAALAGYRETVPHEAGDPVWWGAKGPLGYRGLYHVFERLAGRAGVTGAFNPHAWRHAFGRDTTVAGLPTAQLQGLMGHGDIRVTQVYTQFDDADLQAAHDRYSPVEEDLAGE